MDFPPLEQIDRPQCRGIDLESDCQLLAPLGELRRDSLIELQQLPDALGRTEALAARIRRIDI